MQEIWKNYKNAKRTTRKVYKCMKPEESGRQNKLKMRDWEHGAEVNIWIWQRGIDRITEKEVLWSSIIRVIRFRRMKWTGNVARFRVMRNEYKHQSENRKRSFWRTRLEWESCVLVSSGLWYVPVASSKEQCNKWAFGFHIGWKISWLGVLLFSFWRNCIDSYIFRIHLFV
jgi:hypothetical protein